MGSYPNDRVNSTPAPEYGGTSASSGPASPPSGERGPDSVRIARGARPWRGARRPPGPTGGFPDAATLAADRALIRLVLTVTLGILMVIWGVFLIDEQFGLELRRFGNRPLKADGLAGILAMPLLHGDFQHLWGNTVSFFSLNALLLYFYRNLGFKVLGWSWLATGCLLWLSGADGNHIGLSGVIYSLSAFLFFSGLIRQAPRLIRVSMVVAFLYGSIVWGVFPIEVGVSWQGHLSGAVVGSFLAIAWRKQGPQKPPPPADEDDEQDDGPAPSAAAKPAAQEDLVRSSRRAILESPTDGILGEAAVEDTWLTSEAPSPEEEWRESSRAQRLWRGPRPISSEHAKSRQGGIRKPRRGGHIKSKTRR